MKTVFFLIKARFLRRRLAQRAGFSFFSFVCFSARQKKTKQGKHEKAWWLPFFFSFSFLLFGPSGDLYAYLVVGPATPIHQPIWPQGRPDTFGFFIAPLKEILIFIRKQWFHKAFIDSLRISLIPKGFHCFLKDTLRFSLIPEWFHWFFKYFIDS